MTSLEVFDFKPVPRVIWSQFSSLTSNKLHSEYSCSLSSVYHNLCIPLGSMTSNLLLMKSKAILALSGGYSHEEAWTSACIRVDAYEVSSSQVLGPSYFTSSLRMGESFSHNFRQFMLHLVTIISHNL